MLKNGILHNFIKASSARKGYTTSGTQRSVHWVKQKGPNKDQEANSADISRVTFELVEPAEIQANTAIPAITVTRIAGKPVVKSKTASSGYSRVSEGPRIMSLAQKRRKPTPAEQPRLLSSAEDLTPGPRGESVLCAWLSQGQPLSVQYMPCNVYTYTRANTSVRLTAAYRVSRKCWGTVTGRPLVYGYRTLNESEV